MSLNTGALIQTLNKTCLDTLQAAAGLCLTKTNQTVQIEHWLLTLLSPSDTDLKQILRQFDVEQAVLERDLSRAIDTFRTGNDRTPTLSEVIDHWIRESWVLASIQFKESRVRTGHLILSLLSDDRLVRTARTISSEFDKIKPEVLWRDLPNLTRGTSEEKDAASGGWNASEAGRGAASAEPGRSPGVAAKTPALDQYTVNLTERARSGQIDPVLGRDFEIRQMVDILIRRRQNNPILTGEAGVGKTAVVEGFASRIAIGDVPSVLKNVHVRTLDLGLLQAGAGVKGEFENRLKQVIQEVKSSEIPIILFIDEAHTLIGAGGQAGQGDAANLLKPALARGDLRTIAATTWAEYKRYFEKDAALARRFQVVKIEEPSEHTAVIMMRGLVGMLEQHHRVRILDEAVEASVHLSARYLTGRQLPDKSVSLLDTACARVAIGQAATPPSVEDTRRRIESLKTEQAILEREATTGRPHAERMAANAVAIQNEEAKLATLDARWAQERSLVQELLDLRDRIEEDHTASGSTGEPTVGMTSKTDFDLESATAEMETKTEALRRLQGEDPLMQVCVDAQTIAEVIAGWTGIPVGKMMTDEIQTVLQLREKLEERVVGQTEALEVLSQRISTARAQLSDPKRPIGVFMLVGPSGVGKTETALALAETLYGGERNLVTINMSEYQEAHTVSGLKGSPPGYVGYGEGGVLTEAVRRKPYCVVLLDEVEKAHPDVMELFFQVFDKGVLEDGEGREIDFKNTIILLTSNVGTDTIMKLCSDPETTPTAEAMSRALRPDLLNAFPPAFLGRLTVLPYYPIRDDVLRRIIRLQLEKVAMRLAQNHKARLEFDDSLVEQIASRCTEVESGARNVDHIINRALLPELSRAFLTRMAEGSAIDRVQVSTGSQGEFVWRIE